MNRSVTAAIWAAVTAFIAFIKAAWGVGKAINDAQHSDFDERLERARHARPLPDDPGVRDDPFNRDTGGM